MHLVCDGNSLPLAVLASGGNESDSRYFTAVLDAVKIEQPKGAPPRRPKIVLADKGYDSDDHRRWCRQRGIKAMIPERQTPEGKQRRKRGPKRFFSKELYKKRNVVERLFCRLKVCRRLISRFEKLKDNFLMMIKLAFLRIYLKSYLSDTP